MPRGSSAGTDAKRWSRPAPLCPRAARMAERCDSGRLVCPRCGQPMRLVAFVTDPFALRRILSHLDVPSRPPELHPPARTARVRGGTVVTDDRAARGSCSERDVPFTGTIGILKACARDGTLEADEADAVLNLMMDAGYLSPVRRISDLL